MAFPLYTRISERERERERERETQMQGDEEHTDDSSQEDLGLVQSAIKLLRD